MDAFSRFLVSVSSSLRALLLGIVAAFICRLGKGVDSLGKSWGFSKTSEEFEEMNDDVPSADPEVEGEKESGDGFMFRFPTYEEFMNGKRGTGVCEIVDSNSLLASRGEYEEVSEKGFIDSKEVCLEDEDTVALDKDLKQSHFGGEEENEELEEAERQSDCDIDFADEKDSLVTDSDSASLSIEHMHSLMSRLIDSYSEGFLSDDDFGGNFELDDSALMEEGLKEFKQESEFLSENDFHEDDDDLTDSSPESENLEPGNENEADLDYGDENKLESLWEHQDFLEQLKIELRKVRATGLPTIYEDSESPKMDDLKPWKIDEKFQRQECIDELMKFNKSYKERMRKFDILTYQKLYTIRFLQKDPLKDPFQLLSSQKKSSVIKNVWPFKHKNSDIDPVLKFIKELQCELEVVYVGQMCLSWEFLHWQYGKALDLWDSEQSGSHRYNEVAEEFQQFQVLLQRYIEDEPFQGPRVQHYIKSRCDFRNLLQVPVIRDDMKKGKRFEKGDFAITSDILVEILEECIRIFWKFVKADNELSTIPGKHHPEIENAEDYELLMEVRRSLQKKEKKLKDSLRSGNCILRRFRRHRRDDADDDSDHVLHFFSQVDMKLVSRVLNMSRLTREQLVWCHYKLNRISFVNRRIQVEPSFLLFPC